MIFKKIQKTHWDHFEHFVQAWPKMNSPGKGALSVFKYQQKTNESSLRKMPKRQSTVILYDPSYEGAPIIKTTLTFPKFISARQEPVYSINFLVRYSQFQSPATRVRTTIYDYVHHKILQSTFTFDEFVSTCKKLDFVIILLQRHWN